MINEILIPSDLIYSVPLENSNFSNNSESPFTGKNRCAHFNRKFRNIENLKVCPCSRHATSTPRKSVFSTSDYSKSLLNFVAFLYCKRKYKLKSLTNLYSSFMESSSFSYLDFSFLNISSFFQYSGYTLENLGARFFINQTSLSQRALFKGIELISLYLKGRDIVTWLFMFYYCYMSLWFFEEDDSGTY